MNLDQRAERRIRASMVERGIDFTARAGCLPLTMVTLPLEPIALVADWATELDLLNMCTVSKGVSALITLLAFKTIALHNTCTSIIARLAQPVGDVPRATSCV
jgi:hypothetical protein